MPKKKDHSKKLFMVIAFIVLASMALAYYFVTKPKTSTVVDTYDGTPLDGCGGYKLEDGTMIDTFCFWNQPDIEVTGDIEVGDVVEYRLTDEGSFIREK